jgi:hypothetical protein
MQCCQQLAHRPRPVTASTILKVSSRPPFRAARITVAASGTSSSTQQQQLNVVITGGSKGECTLLMSRQLNSLNS